MSLKENKTIIRRLIEAVNKHNVDLLDELISPDFSFPSYQIRGVDVMKLAIEEEIKGFPGFHVTIGDIIAEGDKVWVHSTTTATHTGEFRGVVPTGKKVTIPGVNIYRIFDGKMVEGWSVTDSTNLLKQLGWIVYTEKAKGLIAKGLFPDVLSPLVKSKREKLKIETQRSISLAENKAIIRSLYDADNKKDWTILDELISPDFFEASLQLRGPEAYKQFTHEFFAGFPDWIETIEDIVAEDDKV